MLSLAEELLLLALLEKKEAVRVAASLSLPFGLAGAALVELVLFGHARVVDGRVVLKEESIFEEGSALAGNELLREAAEKIRKADRPRRLDHWVSLLGMRGSRRSKGVVLSLIQKGILVEEGSLLRWGSPGCSGDQGSFSLKYRLKCRLRDAVFCEEKADPHSIALLGLVEACGMLDHVFTRDELIAARKSLKLLRKNERLGEPFLSLLSQVLSAVEVAVAASVSV
jgi:hypothetical protein